MTPILVFWCLLLSLGLARAEDADGDGYETPEDCDDNNSRVHPGASEVCDNGIDEDCSGADGTIEIWYYDGDGDGYGGLEWTEGCELGAKPEYTLYGGDCDDNLAERSPGLDEVLGSGLDENCDGYSSCWADDDGDGFGGDSIVDLPVDRSGKAACEGDGVVAQGGDCRDDLATVNPAATEICNSLDDDCDGDVDEGLATSSWYQDNDGDGYGDDVLPTVLSCLDDPPGCAAEGGDCDDDDETVHPGAAELWYDGTDQDCDGNDLDQDGDGLDVDQDCDDLDADLQDCSAVIGGGRDCAVSSGARGVWWLPLPLLALAWRRRR